MVETGGARQDSQSNLGRDIAGGQETLEQEGQPLGDGSR